MKTISYEDILDRIHSFQRHGSRLGLERMTVLMKLLGNPQDKMKIIHVAGTNGKGSVCRYLTSVLSANGYKVGLSTSPYLERFTERIEFDGKEISEDDLIECSLTVFKKIEKMIEMGYDSPTEFELITAIGFVYFSRRPMDYLVLEVGLGGRGDSTNIIKKPLATVFTSVSLDHIDVLGNTTREIAAEKAGIIKDGSPVISGVKDEPAAAVIRKTAEDKGCAFYDAGRIRCFNVAKSLEGYSFFLESGIVRHKKICLSMAGMHQIENATLALCVIEVLAKGNIIKADPEKILSGMRNSRQAGRLEVLRERPYFIIDGAHNEAGVKALSKVINEHFPGNRVLLVAGVLADKKVDSLLAGFLGISCKMIATEPDSKRSLPAEKLCTLALDAGLDCIGFYNLRNAFYYALKESKNYDVIVFSGSIYLIGRIREMCKNEV